MRVFNRNNVSGWSAKLSFLRYAFNFCFSICKKRYKICIFLILLALLFGFLNEKRSIVYLGPFIILASFILNNEAKFYQLGKYFVTLIFLFFSTLILQLAVFIPSLSGTEDLILTNDVSYIGFCSLMPMNTYFLTMDQLFKQLLEMLYMTKEFNLEELLYFLELRSIFSHKTFLPRYLDLVLVALPIMSGSLKIRIDFLN